MSNSIERVETPSGATHKTPKGTYMKHATGAWFEWLHEWVKVDSGVHVNANQLTEISGDVMNLKKLTQAVFEGLPKEYRWAAVDANGKAWAFIKKPVCDDLMFCDIERQDVPTAADIDWSWQDAPEGATHYRLEGKLFFYKNDRGLRYWSEARERWIESGEPDLLTSRIGELVEIRKPEPQIESIHDVARSIEAARVAEQSERTYPHYFKDVSDVDAIDLYHVARLYDITDPALFHAFKKIACAGKRGAKDRAQDVQEAIDAMKRWQELSV